MNAANPEEVPNKKFKEREHRFTDLPFKNILTTRMHELGIKNTEFQRELEFPMPNVVSMMKKGRMRLPISKTVMAADILKLDPVFLLGKLLSEGNLADWKVIKSVIGDRLVSANEIEFIEWIREQLNGYDVQLADEADFTQALSPLLRTIKKRESDKTKATLKLATQRKPGPQAG